MRRDLDIDCDPTELVLAPPDRSELQEMFRRFEFRALLQRVDQLDEALPAAEGPVVSGRGAALARRRAARDLADVRLRRGRRPVRVALADEVVVAPRPSGSRARSSSTTRSRFACRRSTTRCSPRTSSSRVARPTSSTDLAAEYGIALDPSPPAEEETEALVRRAALPLRLAPLMRARLAERDLVPLYEDIELPLTSVLARMEDAGVHIDTYRMGEITARLRERVEELEGRAYELAGEEFMLGSTQQVARVLFEQLGLTPGRKGKTGYSTDTRVLQTIRDEHEIVPVIEEWRELTKLVNTYLGPLPELLGEDGRLHTTINQAVAATGRLSTSNPNLQAIPDPHRARP